MAFLGTKPKFALECCNISSHAVTFHLMLFLSEDVLLSIRQDRRVSDACNYQTWQLWSKEIWYNIVGNGTYFGEAVSSSRTALLRLLFTQSISFSFLNYNLRLSWYYTCSLSIAIHCTCSLPKDTTEQLKNEQIDVNQQVLSKWVAY